MAEPKPVGRIVTKEKDRLWERSPELRLQGLWSRAAGPQIAANARVRSLKNGVLTVSCSSGAWACELGLAAGELAARLNRLSPPEEVRRIRFLHQAHIR